MLAESSLGLTLFREKQQATNFCNLLSRFLARLSRANERRLSARKQPKRRRNVVASRPYDFEAAACRDGRR